MYKLSSADSIWGTLRQLDWHWSGSATKYAQNKWLIDPGQSSSVNPGSVGTTSLPEWEDCYTNIPWQ